LAALDNKSIARVSLFGWSMGGFLAVDFALQYLPRVEELFLLGIRKQYDPEILEEIAQKIKSNKRAFLRRFYSDCFFSSTNDGWDWFKNNLMRDYLDNLSTQELLDGLNYLSRARISYRELSLVPKISIFHGEQDKISPIEEVFSMKSSFPEINFVGLKGAGHIPFFGPEFGKYFQDESRYKLTCNG
jgi:pimeloyl-ACP methyl ester carboxylesterase